MKKIIFSGLLETVSEAGLRDALEKFGPVHALTIYREGDESAPIAIVEMAINDVQAFQLTTRVTNIWHDGHMVNARLLLH